MTNFCSRLFTRAILAVGLAFTSLGHAAPPPANAGKPIPEPLKAWEAWATWDDASRVCPTPYSDPHKHLCFWPSRMGLQVTQSGAVFDMVVSVFSETWVPLPGGPDAWPLGVKANDGPVAVIEHDKKPSVHLAAGTYRLEGAYRWAAVPQRISLPPEIGILALVIDGQTVESPSWDAQGDLWLKRNASVEEADKNFLSTKLYAVLEDGIPLWLRTEVELTVSGKSREEDIGVILPEGWKIVAVEGPIPVAVDEAGRMKAQVRAGKWTLHAAAFRFDNPKEIHYAKGAKPAVAEELIAFRAQPELRIVEIGGAPSIDVSQMTFPEKWHDLPVFRWDTATELRIDERMRGMGEQKPAGLTIARELWLDENGHELTFRDHLSGQMQRIWRLDVAEGQNLGSVRSGDQGQLITRNPQNGAPGVEIRARNLDLEATGRATSVDALPATGWRSDAEALNVTLNLPPGWRLFALFGADWVRGDWLTAWTLLDLFLLLIFSLAVFRMCGWRAAFLAFAAFGLSYHEAGAPRYIWLILLAPLALERVVPEGWGRRVVSVGKGIVMATFVLVLVPFVAQQVQQALYPQLEVVSTYGGATAPGVAGYQRYNSPAVAVESGIDSTETAALNAAESAVRKSGTGSWSSSGRGRAAISTNGNLSYDAQARIQTGPGVPEWKWREVSFGWNGPVSASQQVRPVLISLTLERILSTVRVVLLLILAAVLLSVRKLGRAAFRRSGAAAAALVFACLISSASAQVPNQATLDKLRERLLAVSDAYPNAADIPSVSFTLKEHNVTIDAEIHTAIRTGVPLPGRVPAWSPLTVLVDDKPEVSLRRDDGYLWLMLEAGVHHVHVEGSLANMTEWEWTFLLKPRQVKIEAPDWTVSGVRPDGAPEAQVFFARKQKAAAGAASYDRQEVQTIAAIDRSLELGLIWQVHTTVTRLSPVGKAVALRVPLLAGENVLSSNAVVKDGFIEIRLGAQETTFTWDSGLAIVNTLQLATHVEDAWVERWHLVASPVWNVALAGLPPIFEPDNTGLVPVWQPWPGESVELSISRPEAIAGATVTVHSGTHEIALGQRQRTSKLDLSLRCSLGEDFLVDLPAEAEITALTHNGKSIPVRKDGAKLIVPVRPGEQTISIAWKTNVELGARMQTDEVRLPVESANIQTVVTVPDSRWVLWAAGPRRGPAVRYWGILVCSLLAALVLGRLTRSPLHTFEWMLLVIGLTQVPLAAALAVIAWLFLLAWRGADSYQRLGKLSYNTVQIVLIVLTVSALGILFSAVGEGLLGSPEMFIVGNGSTHTELRWFQARSESLLPRCACVSISIWWYRFFMLVWALWLAMALIRWLQQGWKNFGAGGYFRHKPKAQPTPPPIPVKG